MNKVQIKDRPILWIDGIELVKGGQPLLHVWRRRGKRIVSEPLEFSEAPKRIVDSDDRSFGDTANWRSGIKLMDLRSGERLVKPHELLQPAMKDVPLSDRHDIYEFGLKWPLYVPAFVLIRALFAVTLRISEQLFIPGAVDLCGYVRREEDRTYIKLSKRFRNVRLSVNLVGVMAWLLSNSEGRYSHASVLANARDGRIGLDLPKLGIEGVGQVMKVGDGNLLTELQVKKLHYPLDARLFKVSCGQESTLLVADKTGKNSCTLSI